MRIEDIWAELDAELAANAGSGRRTGVLSRLATPEAGQRLHVAVEWPSRCRVLLFHAEAAALPARHTWPECRGLELSVEDGLQGGSCLAVRLREHRHNDVFSVLAEDLARRVVGGSDAEAAGRALAALARWQRFLANAGRSLSDEARRGLWGELWMLEHLLVLAVGVEAAVIGWRGPAGASQDFQHRTVALEVKTRAAKSPAVVRISSELQLHDAPWAALYLGHVAVDEQEGAGETLPQRITALRKLVAGTSAQELFEDSLADVGWLEAETELHASRGFALRAMEFFRVQNDFSRLTPTTLPEGVGHLNYDLALDAVRSHAVPESVVRAAFTSFIN